MTRECSHCHHRFSPSDFLKEDSKGLEADRRSLGLRGLHFFCYGCPECGYEDVFVDLHPLPQEPRVEFRKRRAELENIISEIQTENVDVVLCERAY